MRRPPSKSTKNAAVQAMVVELAPSAGHVGAILTKAAQNPQKRLSAATIKRLHDLLANDLRKIEDACAKTKNSEWPKDLPDEAVDDYEQALQVARLAVFGAATNVAAVTLPDAGCDPEVFRVLGRALNSAMTGSGVEAKKLRALSVTPNALEPVEVEFRAKLVVLAMYARGNRTELKRLYDAAEKCGLDRKQARQIVANAVGGKLKDDTFLQLRKYWKKRLEPEIRAGKKASVLLSQ
jgi:hypothetical protein